MLVLVKEKERRRGHVSSCRRGKLCRCEPRCNNRPAGYEDELMPCYEIVTIQAGVNRIDIEGTNAWWSGRHDKNILHQSYLRRDCMIVAGLCTNASSPLFAVQLYARLTWIRYAHLSAILRYCGSDRDANVDIFSHISPFYYKEALFIKERWQFLSCITSAICMSHAMNDVGSFIKMSLMRLSLRDIYNLLNCTVDVCPKTYYYWYDSVEQSPMAEPLVINKLQPIVVFYTDITIKTFIDIYNRGVRE